MNCEYKFDKFVMLFFPGSEYYEFPHTNVQFDTGSTHEYEIDTICVNECEGAIAALTDDTANVAVTFYDDQGEQVSLHCDA